MDYFTIRNEIVSLLFRANPKANLVNDEIDMFSPICQIAPRDLLYVSMELKRKYEIDYDCLISEVSVFSLRNFTNAISNQELKQLAPKSVA